MTERLNILGGGMAGSEAAWQAARSGVPVTLHEMRPETATFAHRTGDLAEMVCSNSFRSDDDEANAVGLLHWEMRQAGSLLMEMADRHRLPAGGALAVDRDAFSRGVTERLRAEPLVEIRAGEVTALPRSGRWIVATGPLTGASLAADIAAVAGQDSLAFFDAIAPIVHADSIDMDRAWRQSRYDKGDTEEERTAYINCPMTRDEYEGFIDALLSAEATAFRDGETAGYFDGCLPIEVMAERGRETLRFGPMKPVGLTNPHDPERKPYAVVQLRRDNALGTLYNIVGFQTKMRHGEQARVLRMIPALGEARFARLGGIHRNTFVNSPTLLDGAMRLRAMPHIRLAGQITGVEGYVESGAMGLLAGRMAAAEMRGVPVDAVPDTTAMGALVAHITGGADAKTFQPMNVNFGLFPPRGRARRPQAARGAVQGLYGPGEGGLDGVAGPADGRRMSGPGVPKGLWTAGRSEADLRRLYDEWADRYDDDMIAAGSLGPARVAAMLSDVMESRRGPVLDFGCGTGAMGALLREQGFGPLHGVDLSRNMLDRAETLGVYNALSLTEPDGPVDIGEDTAAVTCAGSICVGAAPASTLAKVLDAMRPGAVLVLSYNDDTLRDADYMGAMAQVQVSGLARLDRAEYGPQLPALGRGATVYALTRL